MKQQGVSKLLHIILKWFLQNFLFVIFFFYLNILITFWPSICSGAQQKKTANFTSCISALLLYPSKINKSNPVKVAVSHESSTWY